MIVTAAAESALTAAACAATEACRRSRRRNGACLTCMPGAELAGRITAAFQPIVMRCRRGWSVFAYEALARGPAGEPADAVLGALRRAADPHVVDMACRIAALRDAASLGLAALPTLVSINVLPNAALRPETCLAATVAAARRYGFPPERVLFEMTETEAVRDVALLAEIIAAQRAQGVRVALDDFGAGHSGLGLLVACRPDIVKLDRHLVRGADRDPVRARLARAVAQACRDLGIVVVAEGVETAGELDALHAAGIRHFQGYLLSRPGLGCLPDASAALRAAEATLRRARAAPRA